MIALILQQLFNLALTLLIASLVWRHYRRMTVSPSSRYATFGPRFWTAFVDSCVLWPLGFITTMLLVLNIPKALAIVLLAIQGVAWLIYTVAMHARYGQTVGKMVTKVRVVHHQTEGKISFRQALLRDSIPIVLSVIFFGYEVFAVMSGTATPQDIATGEALAHGKQLWFVAALPVGWFVAETLTMLTNEKRRAIHDFIAGTVVVRTNIAQPVMNDPIREPV